MNAINLESLSDDDFLKQIFPLPTKDDQFYYTESMAIYEKELSRRLADLAALRDENYRLKADNERLLNADFVWRNKYAMIQDDLAKAWADKRELVEVCERLLWKVAGTIYDDLRAAVAKHK